MRAEKTIQEEAGVISSEHAEAVRSRCLSLLINWEVIDKDFGKRKKDKQVKAEHVNQPIPSEGIQQW